MMTQIFDQISVWTLEYNAKKGKFDISLKQTCRQTNIMTCLILPGNKLVFLGSRSGDLMILDLTSAMIVQRVDAHKKEI